jgi:hypothetical protein
MPLAFTQNNGQTTQHPAPARTASFESQHSVAPNDSLTLPAS